MPQLCPNRAHTMPILNLTILCPYCAFCPSCAPTVPQLELETCPYCAPTVPLVCLERLPTCLVQIDFRWLFGSLCFNEFQFGFNHVNVRIFQNSLSQLLNRMNFDLRNVFTWSQYRMPPIRSSEKFKKFTTSHQIFNRLTQSIDEVSNFDPTIDYSNSQCNLTNHKFFECAYVCQLSLLCSGRFP